MAILAVAAVAACAEARSGGVIVTDSAGVRIIETLRPAWEDGDAWQLAAEADLIIGGDEGDADYEFHRIVNAVRLSDGRIVVADERNDEPIRYFDADGELLRRVGGRGEGPNEFQRITRLYRLAGDSVAVFDGSAQRATILDPAGTPVRTFSLALSGQALQRLFEPLSDGRWVVATSSLDPGGEIVEGIRRARATIHLLGPDAARLDTVGTFPGSESAHTILRQGSVTGMAPFARYFGFDVHEDRIWVGTGDAVAVDVYAPDGSHLRSMRWPGEDLSISEADIDTFRTAWLSQAATEDQRRMLNEYMDRVARPERKAAYSGVLVDPSENVWLAPVDSPAGPLGDWRVFAASGEYLGEVRIPDRLNVLDIGTDDLLGAWTDELGVESLHVLRIYR